MRKATQKMIDFAQAIAEELGLEDELRWLENDFDEISQFISDNKDDYYDSVNDRL